MHDYRLREANSHDHETLVTHRVRMFQDMGLRFDAERLANEFRPWLRDMAAKGVYRAWVVESDGVVVAGGGFTILPWPPGPHYPGGRVAFVYNVFTEPAHRHRGLARRLMDAMHAWCRQEGISNVALNASRDGQPLYESMGYAVASSPMMFLAIE